MALVADVMREVNAGHAAATELALDRVSAGQGAPELSHLVSHGTSLDGLRRQPRQRGARFGGERLELSVRPPPGGGAEAIRLERAIPIAKPLGEAAALEVPRGVAQARPLGKEGLFRPRSSEVPRGFGSFRDAVAGREEPLRPSSRYSVAVGEACHRLE